MYLKTNEVIQKQLELGVFPCANWAFLEGEQVATFLKGYASLVPEKELLKENMLFDLASLTKVICTGSVLLKLWEEGKIDLTMPLSAYYPSFQDERVTLLHLLTHTSDIHFFIKNRDNLSAKELREAYNGVKSGELLGKAFQYTDTGMLLFGFMIEELFGLSAQEVFQQEVLDKIGMQSACFQEVFPVERAVPTEWTEKRGFIRGMTHDPKAFTLGVHAGSAGLFATLKDIVSYTQKVFFEQAFHSGEIIEKLLLDWTGEQGFSRSLGWELKSDELGRKWLFHSGFTGTFLLIQPEIKRAFLFLSNRVHPENHRESYILHRDELIQTYLQEQSEKHFMI